MGDKKVSIFAETVGREPRRQFGVTDADRLLHMLVIGRTGAGKSSMLGRLAREDFRRGHGLCVIDPHGDLVEQLAEDFRGCPNLTYFDVADDTQPFGHNPLRRVRADMIPLAASGLLETLKKLWPDAWGVRMEHVLRSTLYALLERDNSTLIDILRLYNDDNFRKQVVREIRNPVVKAFFRSEFAKYTWRYRAEAVAPIQNKLGALLSDPHLYRILVEPKIDLRFRKIMDTGGVLLVNLAKGRVGEDSAGTLGSLLLSTLGLAASSRADSPLGARRPFMLLVDEFPALTTLAFANLMIELRKYGVGLTLGAQHLAQMEPAVRHAVTANVGSLLSFRVGAEDAAMLAREFAPSFMPLDLLTLAHRHFYVRLVIDGAPSRPFSARTLDF